MTVTTGPTTAAALVAHDSSGNISSWSLERRAVGPRDVQFKVTHCGICHSDLHQIKNEWANSIYPMVPGHEVVGVVTAVGSEVSKFRVGDHVGVGCMINSCRNCDACEAHAEQFCGQCVFTYNGTENGKPTYGGYSTVMVTDQDFVLHVPSNLPLDAAAPLLCAGITVYSPIVRHGLNVAGLRVGVAGLGGLGHMAIKFLKAFGCHVTVLSTSPNKKEEALSVLGADEFLVSRDEQSMAEAAKTLHGIVDTISADHDIKAFLNLLKFNGKLILVGAPPTEYKISPFQLLFGNMVVAGSLIGGIKETQEMLDFCGEKNVVCTIEKIPATPESVNNAMERLAKGQVHYRFVLDIEATLKA